jgi:DNA mismatch repair protein MutS2
MVDALLARARFADSCGGVRPAVTSGGSLVLGDVRHPLLDRRLREAGQACVPLRLTLDPHDQVLVLSGPNTGGKTVAIKTIGLAVLMAQSGIPVPASEVRLPLYRQLRSDIGDHQSIEADLSTFSAHIRVVVGCLRDAAPPALFLFDEIGGGTEPAEGAALAQSIFEALQVPGMTAVATTHQQALKSWAFMTDGAASAAMEFDRETLRPTYRVLMGAAGVSAGLEIAERLGLAPELVARARERLGADSRRGEEYLSRLAETTGDLERLRDEVADRVKELDEERHRLRDRAENDRRTQRDRVDRALDRALEEFRALARREVRDARDRQERKRAEREMAKIEQRLRMERERQVSEVAPGTGDDDGGPWVVPEAPGPGMKVHVRSLARDGIVRGVRGEKVDVEMGRVTFTVARRDLRVPAGHRDAEAARRPGPPAPRPSPTPRSAPPVPETEESVEHEIKLIGRTVDEALPELDRFLDAAALAGLPEVRVIHGHGTGRLRAAVRTFLRGHVHADSWRPGRPPEGGDGATIVRLRN